MSLPLGFDFIFKINQCFYVVGDGFFSWLRRDFPSGSVSCIAYCLCKDVYFSVDVLSSLDLVVYYQIIIYYLSESVPVCSFIIVYLFCGVDFVCAL